MTHASLKDTVEEIYQDIKSDAEADFETRYARAKTLEDAWFDSRKEKGCRLGTFHDEDFVTDRSLGLELRYEQLGPFTIVTRIGAIETLAKLRGVHHSKCVNMRNYELECGVAEALKHSTILVIGEFCPFNGAFASFGNLPAEYVEDAIDSYPQHMHDALRENVARRREVKGRRDE